MTFLASPAPDCGVGEVDGLDDDQLPLGFSQVPFDPFYSCLDSHFIALLRGLWEVHFS